MGSVGCVCVCTCAWCVSQVSSGPHPVLLDLRGVGRCGQSQDGTQLSGSLGHKGAQAVVPVARHRWRCAQSDKMQWHFQRSPWNSIMEGRPVAWRRLAEWGLALALEVELMGSRVGDVMWWDRVNENGPGGLAPGLSSWWLQCPHPEMGEDAGRNGGSRSMAVHSCRLALGNLRCMWR